jgi:uncharacterized protein
MHYLRFAYKKDMEQIEITQNWIKNVIIGCNFCPFAAKAVQLNAVHFHLMTTPKTKACLEQLVHECTRLDQDDTIETTLILLPEGFGSFHDYLDLLDMGERLLIDIGYEGTYQLASFHPEYCFADAEIDDPANYTNRSPYPMLHILREASVELAIKNYPDAEAIPARNMAYAREKGLEFMRGLK